MHIVDTPPIADDIYTISQIPVIQKILEVVCNTTGMGFAAVARVTGDQWIACAVRDEIDFGLKPGGELQIETTICHEIRQSGRKVVIDHVASDHRYANHPTPALYGFQSYISVPIVLKNDEFFGTLCAIDPKPALVNTPATVAMFELYAELIAMNLQQVRERQVVESSLREEKRISVLREQFIAILGHDLRNPLQAILNGAQLIMQMQENKQGHRIAEIIQNASYRMRSLIENMLDFANGRLGQGIKLNRGDDQAIENLLEEIVSEQKILWPNREIRMHIDLPYPVNADGKRIAQLFSNLLNNALTYGTASKAVEIQVFSTRTEFVLSIQNPALRIPAETLSRLFQPFARGNDNNYKEGLGLGLFIASEIARAHGGTLSVESDDHLTRFVFRMKNFNPQ